MPVIVKHQNIPIGTKLARDILRQGEGKTYIPIDYSGLEMRIINELLKDKTRKV